jgi:thioredoxin-related protein
MIAFAGTRVALAVLAVAVLSSLAGLSAAANAAELVVFGSARCPYCLAWEREIGHGYAKTREARRAPLRRLDIEARRPGDLARLREVDVTPTFVLVDDEGREAGRIVGYSGRQLFWPQLHRLLARLHPRQL